MKASPTQTLGMVMTEPGTRLLKNATTLGLGSIRCPGTEGKGAKGTNGDKASVESREGGEPGV